MNRHESSFLGSQEAVIDYGDGEFVVVKQGQYVRCAMTGVRIPLEELRYWSVDRNEAYASPAAVLMRVNGQGPG